MKKLKWIIITVVLIIVVLGVILFFNVQKDLQNTNSTNKDNTSTSDVERNDDEVLKSADELGIIPNNTNKEIGYVEMFTISNCISQYLDTLDKTNSKYYGKDENGNMVLNVSEEEINKNINALKSENANNSIQMLNEKNIFTLLDALKIVNGNVDSYIAYGFTTNSDNKYQKDCYFIVNLDNKNNTFSIEELNGSNIDINTVTTNALEKIENNSYNEFTYQNISQEYISIKYLENYKKILLAKPELAYEYLEDEYKSKRYESYDDFYNHIQTIRNKIEEMSVKKYKTNEDNTQILVKDDDSNIYRFYISGTMKYKIIMYDYIILADSQIKEYNNLKDEEKFDFNVKRWITMLNNREYKYAYKFLDETFRNEKFGSEEKFEKYIQEKYPLTYNYSYEEKNQEGNVYTADLELSNSDEEFSDKYITIIMKSDEDANFSLSFEVQ